MKKNNLLKLIFSISLPLGLSGFAASITVKSIPTWYATLVQPSFNPPNWVFGPVWTILYIALGISFFLIWKEPASKARNQAIIAFSVQMILNSAWSFIFFYFNQIGFALIDIVALLISIIVMMRAFYKINPLSTYLNIPYLLWVSFATALNAAYYILN